ncbi:MAG TPA: hypothetical protein VE616_10365, partial [Candidatus Udaeobacter sp.]|nr:hypothetical protein [Candidatus Udaeobacter sp.]
RSTCLSASAHANQRGHKRLLHPGGILFVSGYDNSARHWLSCYSSADLVGQFFGRFISAEQFCGLMAI